MEVVWEDPPETPRRGRPLQYAEVYKALEARPGEWAKWPRTYAATTAGVSVRTLVMRRWGVGQAEVRSRVIDGETHVWVRYLGNGSEA